MTPTGELLESLVAAGTRRSLADGERLCSEGELSSDAFVVVHGELTATATAHNGTITVARHGPGAIVGEITAIIGGERTATLTARGRTEVAAVAADALRTAFDRHPDESDQLLREARERTDRTRVAVLLADELDATDPEVVAEIARRVTWRHLAAGDVLFECGDDADAAYLVVSGRLSIDRAGAGRLRSVGGAQHHQATPLDDRFDPSLGDGADPGLEIGRGGIVGEFGLLERRTRNATVRAVRDSTLARLSAADFATLTTDFASLAAGLLRRILDRRRIHGTRRMRPARSVVVLTLSSAFGAADRPGTAARSRREAGLGTDGEWPVGTAANRAATAPAVAFGAVLAAFGPTRVCAADDIDRALAHPGIADTPAGAFGEVRLGELLHHLETDFDHVVYDAGDPRSGWARRIVKFADLVVAVVDPEPSPAERAGVEQAFGAAPTDVPRWLAVVHPETMSRPRFGARLRTEFAADEVHHLRGGSETLSADLARVGRLAGGRGVALVLSGGGARGNAHIGVMRALTEHGVPIDRVVGASMGSIVGGTIAQGRTWEQVLADTVAGSHDILDYTLPLVSLVQGRRIVEVLRQQFGGWTLDDTWLPFACVSTDLTTAAAVDHRHGPMVDAIRASIAIPGVLPPVPHGTDLLVDGGVLHNLPVHLVADDPSIGTIIASDVAPPVGPGAPSDYGLAVSGWSVARRRLRKGAQRAHPRLSAVLMRSMLIGSARDRDHHLRSGVIDLYLELDLRGIGLLDFSTVERAAVRGYESAAPLVAEFARRAPAAIRRPV